MKSSPESLSIGAAAARFGLPPHVLRHWESMGLLAPGRYGDRRRYGPDDLYRIAAVIRAKQAGLALDDIGELYTAPDGPSRKQILRRHASALRQRIAETQAALELVEHGIACPHEDMLDCPKFRANVADLVRPLPDERPG